MDFSLTDDQRALSNLAAQILTDRCTLERLKAIEASDERYDRELWGELAKAGLLGAALPESVGGSDGGFFAACLLLEQQGKRVAMLPVLSTIVSAALPLACFGSKEQQQSYLPGVVAGTTLLSAALSELNSDSRSPVATATPEGKNWRLSGVKVAVPMAHSAAAVLVPARTAGGDIGVFLVDPKAPGVTLARQETMNWEAHFRMDLSNVTVGADSVLGSIAKGAEILGWIVDRTTVGVCALAAGACQEAVRLTAEYASNRKQFDKPIAMFQAVGQRMADSFIDNEAVTLTMWQAASRLADEMPSDKEIASAKYWAAEGGSRIGHAGLHIHGGISIDIDYPIHRYFLWIKQAEYTLGAATPQLVRLGALIAAEPA
ncbi:MAG: acyl-CoA dehydrogenase family protein [Deltaproteobacteria bacterium]|nr:acyl-CoA dehydrogenase family protein [Deltaproteobacteria bacterium]MBI3386513.1 acyl-CoA dehydrogenase family protein [Deltaproteobacteria bacterium]